MFYLPRLAPLCVSGAVMNATCTSKFSLFKAAEYKFAVIYLLKLINQIIVNESVSQAKTIEICHCKSNWLRTCQNAWSL